MAISDKKIEQAIEKAGGQPTKAAEILGITYVHFWRITKDRTEMQDLMKSYRAKTFHELSTLSITAIKTGLLQKLVKNKDGTETVYEDVDARTRLEMASRFMNMTKSDAGIVDKQQHEHEVGGSFLEFLKQTSVGL
jgi:hypothetical protein